MTDSNNLSTARRHTTAKRTSSSQSAAAKLHTVSRYRLRLLKEDTESIPEPETLRQPSKTAAFLWKRVFDGLDREAMCALYVDVKLRVIGWTVAYVGCLSHCCVEPRGLVVPALLANASGLIIAHNHPAGSPEPSEEDRLFTKQMQLACDALKLNLVDSLVVAEGPAGPRWTSILKAVSG
ncbi:MAG TPA: JAB domain-containing protein [Thermoanaerobaculia bacterium]|nr:JAB domain-containing protein [Thermoanaerobaculia bacterium]